MDSVYIPWQNFVHFFRVVKIDKKGNDLNFEEKIHYCCGTNRNFIQNIESQK